VKQQQFNHFYKEMAYNRSSLSVYVNHQLALCLILVKTTICFFMKKWQTFKMPN